MAKKLGVHHPGFLLLAGDAHTDDTTNAVEMANSVVRKAVRNRGHFPKETSALKSVFMLLEAQMAKWTMPVRCWASAKIQLAIQFGEGFNIQD